MVTWPGLGYHSSPPPPPLIAGGCSVVRECLANSGLNDTHSHRGQWISSHQPGGTAQRQTAVTADLKSKQLPLFIFAVHRADHRAGSARHAPVYHALIGREDHRRRPFLCAPANHRRRPRSAHPTQYVPRIGGLLRQGPDT